MCYHWWCATVGDYWWCATIGDYWCATIGVYWWYAIIDYCDVLPLVITGVPPLVITGGVLPLTVTDGVLPLTITGGVLPLTITGVPPLAITGMPPLAITGVLPLAITVGVLPLEITFAVLPLAITVGVLSPSAAGVVRCAGLCLASGFLGEGGCDTLGRISRFDRTGSMTLFNLGGRRQYCTGMRGEGVVDGGSGGRRDAVRGGSRGGEQRVKRMKPSWPSSQAS